MKGTKNMKIIDLSATWCGPCKVFANTFAKVKEKYESENVQFLSYDVEEDDEGVDLSEKYIIRNVPTVLIIDDNGKELGRVSGNVPQYTLEDKIKDLLTK